jgi:hypothetical protein
MEKEQLSGGAMATTARFLSDETPAPAPAPAPVSAATAANGLKPQSINSFNPASACESRSVLVADLSRPQPVLGSDRASSGFICGVLSRSDSTFSSTSLRETGGLNSYILSPAPSNASGGDYQPSALPPSCSLTPTVAAMSETPLATHQQPTKITSPAAANKSELGRRPPSPPSLTVDMKDGSYRHNPYGWSLAVQAATGL